MASIEWTDKLINAPYDVVEAAIQKVLNGAPVPHISPTYALSQIILDDNPEYRSEYLDLCRLYVNEFGGSDKLELNEYGFSTWESVHPVINALHLLYNKFHWYHMKSIVKRIERKIRIQELESGQHFSQQDRTELVAAKAWDERESERRRALQEWRDQTITGVDHRLRASNKAIAEQLIPSKRETGSLVDRVLEYNTRNPLTFGIMGASLYHSIKDAFTSK